MFSVFLTAAETFLPVSKMPSSKCAETLSPVWVVVPRINPSIVSQVRKGFPAQWILIWLNKQCSMGFHFEQPVG